MTDKKRVAVSPYGLTSAELRLLKTICAVSESRGRPYSLVWSPEPVVLPTLWVVDADAIGPWKEQHRADSKMAVTVGAPALPGAQSVPRPLTASRLLALLDLLAEKQVGQMAELVIGGAARGREREEEPGAVAPSISTGSYSRYTALVVDDSPTVQKQIELGLRLNGVGALCVASGEAALEALEQRDFDLIFLDVVLSGETNGYQICKAIKKSQANRNTPVIMLTSKSGAFDRVRGSMVGCDTYLTKPVNTETFNAIVAKYLPQTQGATASFGQGQVPV